MDWDHGFSSSIYATFVDPDTWRDQTRFEITGGSIKRSIDDLREAADLNCTSSYTETSEKWIRVWLDAKQPGSSSHTPLFTGLAISPGKSINGIIETKQLQCYSVLKPAQDILLQRGWYAPAGIDSGFIIKKLLSVTPAPIEIDPDAPKLTDPIISMDGDTNLSMALLIADVVQWQIKLGGDGVIHVTPLPKTPTSVKRFDAFSYDVIESNLSMNYDWYNCPNVFRAIVGNTVAIARDDNPDSIFSTVSRGREVWAEENGYALNDKETIAEYANRRLRELQTIYLEMSYSRRFDPDVNVLDIVDINYPAQSIQGTFIVTSQSISLGTNINISEEVRAI